jgi:radical SAM-linked protein
MTDDVYQAEPGSSLARTDVEGDDQTVHASGRLSREEDAASGGPGRPGRIRIRFSKQGKVRFTSHRDVARIWERALRRAELPLAYTEGFSPRPKLSFGLALSTGYESLGEYLDVALRQDDVELEQLPTLLDPVLPVGVEVQVAVRLPAGAESLQQAVTSCTWHVELRGSSAADARRAVAQVLDAEELVVRRERKGREVSEDIRPGILAVRVLDPSEVHADSGRGTWLEAELATQPRSLRPAELVGALDPTKIVGTVVRIHQWTQAGGARQEVVPLPSAATLARTPEARAS